LLLARPGVREQVFTPRLKCSDLAELNALLERRCVEIAQRIAHPEQRERTRWAAVDDVKGLRKALRERLGWTSDTEQRGLFRLRFAL
jgi:hypothetical protein